MSLQLVTAMTCVLFVAMVGICCSVLDVLKHFIQVGICYCYRVVDLLVHSIWRIYNFIIKRRFQEYFLKHNEEEMTDKCLFLCPFKF